jgi:hypothetical protein
MARVTTVTTSRGLGIQVEGLTELRRDLRKAADSGISKRLTRDLKNAAKVVANDARSRVPDGPPRNGHARSTIKAGANQKGAYVQGGRNAIPYYGWLDFGSRTPNGGILTGQSRSQRRALARQVNGQRVGPWAGSGTGPKGGRFIYPAIEANQTRIVRETANAVDKALKEVNL